MVFTSVIDPVRQVWYSDARKDNREIIRILMRICINLFANVQDAGTTLMVPPQWPAEHTHTRTHTQKRCFHRRRKRHGIERGIAINPRQFASRRTFGGYESCTSRAPG